MRALGKFRHVPDAPVNLSASGSFIFAQQSDTPRIWQFPVAIFADICDVSGSSRSSRIAFYRWAIYILHRQEYLHVFAAAWRSTFNHLLIGLYPLSIRGMQGQRPPLPPLLESKSDIALLAKYVRIFSDSISTSFARGATGGS